MKTGRDIPERCLACGHLDEAAFTCGINVNTGGSGCFLYYRITGEEYRARKRRLGLPTQEKLFE